MDFSLSEDLVELKQRTERFVREHQSCVEVNFARGLSAFLAERNPVVVRATPRIQHMASKVCISIVMELLVEDRLHQALMRSGYSLKT